MSAIGLPIRPPTSKENGFSPGALVVLNKRYGPFTREDEELGTAVANQVSVVLREARLFGYCPNFLLLLLNCGIQLAPYKIGNGLVGRPGSLEQK